MKRVTILVVILIVIMLFCLYKSSESRKLNCSPRRIEPYHPYEQDVQVSYYFNPGCHHCRAFNPVWKDFSTSTGSASFREVNCSANPELCGGINAVPFVVFSRRGHPPVPFTGSRDKKSLEKFLMRMKN
jgi:thiol-disulfide isomerase/thioredoxin